jgi:hypothetical protein
MQNTQKNCVDKFRSFSVYFAHDPVADVDGMEEGTRLEDHSTFYACHIFHDSMFTRAKSAMLISDVSRFLLIQYFHDTYSARQGLSLISN